MQVISRNKANNLKVYDVIMLLIRKKNFLEQCYFAISR